MARPVANQRALAAKQANARRLKGRPPKGRGSMGLVVGTLSLVLLAGFALPTCVLFVAGMLPSGVAMVVDRHPRKFLAISVSIMNLAGVLPVAIKLWTGVNTMVGLTALLANVFVWLAFYGAAGVGWLLHFGMPIIATAVLKKSLANRRKALGTFQQKLVEEWGEEVMMPGEE
ncbi:MAG TPA: hypothetical protein VNT30_15175 [Stellaceae bacterium]|nr:hypothetical protein [Stellaceae bacterium]